MPFFSMAFARVAVCLNLHNLVVIVRARIRITRERMHSVIHFQVCSAIAQIFRVSILKKFNFALGSALDTAMLQT